MVKASIVGNGAIGSLVAANCHRQNLPFAMWWRNNSPDPLYFVWQNVETITLYSETPKTADLLVIPTKAWQVKEVLSQYHSSITPDTIILLLHNGIGTEDQVLQAFPNNPILRMTTSKAAKKVRSDTVCETGEGKTDAGWLRKPDKLKTVEMETWCSLVFGNCQWHANIRMPLWRKLAVNAVINPLTAIHDIKNGELQQTKWRETIEQLVLEFVQVAIAEGLNLTVEETLHNIYSVIDSTAQNHSSMHQDVQHKRQTEIDYINGYLLQLGDEHNIALPGHSKLFHSIKTLAATKA